MGALEFVAVEYRLFRPDDFAALYAIEEVCFDPPHRFSRVYMRQLIAQRHTVTWVALREQKLCAFGVVECAEEADGLAGYVQTLEVLPEFRGHGIGGELLRLLGDSARAAGARILWLHVNAANHAAIRVYERDGYRAKEKKENYYGRGHAALILVKELEG